MRENRVYFDGGMGSLLQERGLAPGELPETWNLLHPEVLVEIHRAYLEAGANIMTTNTFGANRLKYPEGGQWALEELVRAAVENAAEARRQYEENCRREGRQCQPSFIALDLGPTGKLLKPYGDLEFEAAVALYQEVVKTGAEAGADLILIETMSDSLEVKAAVLAAKENCSLPVFATMAFDEKGKLLTGGDVESVTALLEGLRVDALGLNCGLGPEQMAPIAQRFMKVSSTPVIVNPNAGLPRSEGSRTVYDINSDQFARKMREIAEMGVFMMGGCCGTTPEHIRKLKAACDDLPVQLPEKKGRTVICSYATTVEFGSKPVIIGERINPTGKKKLQAELREGRFDLTVQFAEEQEEAGAAILDVNMGMSGVDEKALMLHAIDEVTQVTQLPLSLDSSHIDVLEAALRRYPGRALINSISLETEKFEKLIPMAKKYGAMFILLPLSDAGLPGSLQEKKDIIEKIWERAASFGLTKEDIVVDGLVTTVGANPEAAKETLETIRYCRQNDFATVVGLSNISFGLPERIQINSAFLTMAIQSGLTMAIANPSQQQLMAAAFASDLLLNKEGAAERYIAFANACTARAEAAAKNAATAASAARAARPSEPSGEKAFGTGNAAAAGASSVPAGLGGELYEAVLKGNRNGIAALTEKALESGLEAGAILNDCLMPAINRVGELFDCGRYFLPQLISGAEAMKLSIGVLEPYLLQDENREKLPVVVLATVKGDIHDIGKNLVALMMKNYGFQVIDLGKDVPAEDIIRTAKENNAALIGLSALMTTTMQEMKHVILLAKEAGLTAKIIIGGAVITQEYADEIHADGYSKDAADAVRLAKRLLGL